MYRFFEIIFSKMSKKLTTLILDGIKKIAWFTVKAEGNYAVFIDLVP